MRFVRTIPGYNHLWAVKDEEKETDELSLLFRQWNNFNYLLDFFFANLDDLQSFFHVERISDAIQDTMEDARELERLILDFPYTERLDGLFHPLSLKDSRAHELTREKATFNYSWQEGKLSLTGEIDGMSIGNVDFTLDNSHRVIKDNSGGIVYTFTYDDTGSRLI